MTGGLMATLFRYCRVSNGTHSHVARRRDFSFVFAIFIRAREKMRSASDADMPQHYFDD